jgi:hypothetical protein
MVVNGKKMEIQPVQYFIANENLVLIDHLKLSPSVIFISQSLNNYLACSLSVGVVESMKLDIQEGTKLPTNLVTQTREKKKLS